MTTERPAPEKGLDMDWYEQVWADAGLQAPSAPVFRKVVEAAREKGRAESDELVAELELERDSLRASLHRALGKLGIDLADWEDEHG